MLRLTTLQVALLAVVLGPRLASADFQLATSVYVNTSWRTIGPVGDLTVRGINDKAARVSRESYNSCRTCRNRQASSWPGWGSPP